MKILASQFQMASSHSRLEQHEIRESLRFTSRPRAMENRSPPGGESVEISRAGKKAAANQDDALESAAEHDPRMQLILQVVEALTGRKIKVFDRQELAQAASAELDTREPSTGFSVEYERHESYREMEAASFSASGSVITADGQTIRFDLTLAMSREYHEESNVSLRFEAAARKQDPLILNFAGNAASLKNERFSFDLNGDGHNEQVASLGSGSAYLVFDRNGDGRVSDGGEMFGPATGNGFGELAALDGDGNGWIDENDPAFKQLGLWQPDARGEGALRPLGQAQVGALSLANLSTPFDIKAENNQLLGAVRNSGMFLQENGQVGSIQQVDLVV